MAITPRSFLRNPLLLMLALALTLPAAYFLFAGSCPSSTQANSAELAKVKLESSRNIATIQAQRNQPVAQKDGKGWLGIHIQTRSQSPRPGGRCDAPSLSRYVPGNFFVEGNEIRLRIPHSMYGSTPDIVKP